MMLAGIGVGSLGSLKVELGALGFDEITLRGQKTAPRLLKKWKFLSISDSVFMHNV